MEGTEPQVPWAGAEQSPVGAEPVDGVEAKRPARRRRSAVIGGGALVAVSPVAVAGGLFVPGFAALGLGTLLLLLPPRARSEHDRRSLFRVVRGSVAAGGRGVAWIGRGTASVGARTFGAVGRFAAGPGRRGAARIGRATVAWAAGLGRAGAWAGSHWSSWVQVVAPRVIGGVDTATRSLAREARSASTVAWVRVRPTIRRAGEACLSGARRAEHELAAQGRSVSEQLSALVDARSSSGQVGSPGRAPRRPPARSSRDAVRQARAPSRRARSDRRSSGGGGI